MNALAPDHLDPGRAEAEAALALLRRWAEGVTPEEVADLDPAVARLLPGAGLANTPVLSRQYDADFHASEAYRATLSRDSALYGQVSARIDLLDRDLGI